MFHSIKTYYIILLFSPSKLINRKKTKSESNKQINENKRQTPKQSTFLKNKHKHENKPMNTNLDSGQRVLNHDKVTENMNARITLEKVKSNVNKIENTPSALIFVFKLVI